MAHRRIHNYHRSWLVGLLLLAGSVGGCSLSNLSDYIPTAAATVGAGLAAPAGPAAAAAGAAIAGGVTESVIPKREQRELSDNPEIAKAQLKAEEKELWTMVLKEWGIYIIIGVFILGWFGKTPADLIRGMRGSKNE